MGDSTANKRAPALSSVLGRAPAGGGSTPQWGSRSVELFEKVEQVGEGTYGCAPPQHRNDIHATHPAPSPPPPYQGPSTQTCAETLCACLVLAREQAGLQGEEQADAGVRGAQEGEDGQREGRGALDARPELPQWTPAVEPPAVFHCLSLPCPCGPGDANASPPLVNSFRSLRSGRSRSSRC